jgi:hypothetical protein
MRFKSISFVIFFCSLLVTSTFQLTGVTEADLRFDDNRTGSYMDKVIYEIIASESDRVNLQHQCLC